MWVKAEEEDFLGEVLLCKILANETGSYESQVAFDSECHYHTFIYLKWTVHAHEDRIVKS